MESRCCSVCGKTDARYHICRPPHGFSSYCENCVPAEVRRAIEQAGRACCNYCGGWPTSPSLLPFVRSAPRSLCSGCALEYTRVMVKKLNGLDATRLPEDEQLRQLEGAAAEVDLHMRRWVSARSPQ